MRSMLVAVGLALLLMMSISAEAQRVPTQPECEEYLLRAAAARHPLPGYPPDPTAQMRLAMEKAMGFDALCSPPRPPASARPSAPVPSAEADRQLEGVLKQGPLPEKCTNKPYGGGWVTICE